MTNQENGGDLKSAAVTEEKKLFIETYGCQMNVADSEVVASIMKMDGYAVTDKIEDADAIFVNTCSVRDNAEQKIYGRLQYFQSLKRKKKSLFVRFETGEGIEKKNEDFAAEVAAQLK